APQQLWPQAATVGQHAPARHTPPSQPPGQADGPPPPLPPPAPPPTSAPPPAEPPPAPSPASGRGPAPEIPLHSQLNRLRQKTAAHKRMLDGARAASDARCGAEITALRPRRGPRRGPRRWRRAPSTSA